MKEQENAAFAQRLRALREAAGLTQTELAERAGLHRQAIAKLELSEREPAWSTVVSLADALGVSLDAFRKADGPAAPSRPGRAAKPKAEAPAPKRPRVQTSKRKGK